MATRLNTAAEILQRSRYKKTYAAVNSNLIKKLDHVNNALYEVEIVKAQIDHKETILIAFFIPQDAKLRMLELYYNFFAKFCNIKKSGELDMDTDSLYLALAKNELEECIWPKMKAKWGQLQSKDCTDCFTADAVGSSFPDFPVTSRKTMTNESLVFSKRNLIVRKICVFVVKLTAATKPPLTS